MSSLNTGHWADLNAEKVLREKGDKPLYTCASGITPSGTVHIGNFREIISVDLVVRALRDRGKQVRFIYSWDDYDVFRKVPKNMPQPELLTKYLRMPITLVPDTLGRGENYARGNELDLEKLLPLVGVTPEYIYQAERYTKGYYAEGIRHALLKKDDIRKTLDEYRTEPLEADWWPVSVFCHACNRDDTKIEGWDGDWALSYSCPDCGNKETIDLRTAKGAKLPWRIDWPMRWVKEGVDFEPAGKDHHSEGGSFDTARLTVQVYGGTAPVSFQYDFISIKGRGGKISSSSGEVIGLDDVLEVYTPEVTRFLFAGTRPNAEFAISFDLDVLKIYEDYDKCERIYYGAHEVNEKEKAKQSRIYELSQMGPCEAEMPYQVTIRHLGTLLQTYSGDVERTLAALDGVKDSQKARLRTRAQCTWNWITNFAPEDFRFAIQPDGTPARPLEPAQALALKKLVAVIDAELEALDEKALNNRIYAVAEESGVDPKALFLVTYQALVGKDQGPRLASFLKIIGRERLLKVLGAYE
ncbi:MAG: lysine--tRNA ligase [Spirochaetales bacterium]